jgi:hypothetical protein
VLKTAEKALSAAKTSKSPFHVAEVEAVAETGGFAIAVPASAEGLSETGPRLEDTRSEGSAREEERRRAPRHRVLMRGMIVTSDLLSSMECTIRNLSSTGAGLRLDGLSPAPEQFELLFLRTGQRRRARVRWQNGADVGVEFY